MARANAVTLTLSDPEGPFITCCYGVVDVASATFSWALAGHLPPLLVRDGVARHLDAPRNPPLTIGSRGEFGSAEVGTRPGDRLVLCTDGLVERRGEVIDAGFDRLRSDVLELGGLDAQAAAEALGATVLLPLDDLAVVVLDIGGPPGTDRSDAVVTPGTPPVPGRDDR
jgi:serine phosphatase RsbU (regulator of sigma subunit)